MLVGCGGDGDDPPGGLPIVADDRARDRGRRGRARRPAGLLRDQRHDAARQPVRRARTTASTATAYVYLDGELQPPAPPQDVASGANVHRRGARLRSRRHPHRHRRGARRPRRHPVRRRRRPWWCGAVLGVRDVVRGWASWSCCWAPTALYWGLRRVELSRPGFAVPDGAAGPWYRWRGHDDVGSIEEDTAETHQLGYRSDESHVAHDGCESGRRP